MNEVQASTTTDCRVLESDAWHHSMIYTNGQRLRAIDEDEGPLILLSHGFPESWSWWANPIRPRAELDYRVVAPDMLGYGRSTKPVRTDSYRITELVEDCTGIIRALGEETAVIVGHDWGAIVAWTAAWTRTEMFPGVIGMSVAFGGRDKLPIAGPNLGSVPLSVLHCEIAGPDRLFYQEYWTRPGALQGEFDADPLGYLRDHYWSFSAGPYGQNPTRAPSAGLHPRRSHRAHPGQLDLPRPPEQ